MVATETHYTVGEVVKFWRLSDEYVRQRFRDEPGVLKVERPETLHKRKYTTLRIPESVLIRVHGAPTTSPQPSRRRKRLEPKLPVN